jgi:hypothetical protein
MPNATFTGTETTAVKVGRAACALEAEDTQTEVKAKSPSKADPTPKRRTP